MSLPLKLWRACAMDAIAGQRRRIPLFRAASVPEVIVGILPKEMKSGPLPILDPQQASKGRRLAPARASAHWYVVAAILAWFAVVAPVASAQVFSPDAVKAAFLHRFASYVEWPREALGDRPFVIAVAGSDEVADNLEELLPGLVLQGRTAEVRRVTRANELDGVHILYIGPGAAARSRELRTTAIERPILVVTDGEAGFEGGGIINFRVSGNRVRFEVSLPAADRAGLRIDSALLPVAARVEREPQAWLPLTPSCAFVFVEPVD